jgi:hypothetical protein
MTWTVVWKPAAERELARLWTDTDDRDAVRLAADRMDDLLRSQPTSAGESRGGALRILLGRPLGVIFHLSAPDRLVSVLRVWRTD